MKLIIVRHGETEENQKGIIQGHLPGKLNELGIAQAKKLAIRLKDEKIDAIYSSDLARASDTTNEIARYHSNIPINFVTELREKDQGSITGKNLKEIDWSKPRDTEKKEMMAKRAQSILNEVYEQYKNGTVLFISHGGLIKILTALINKIPLDETKNLPSNSNASISIFEIREDGDHKIILSNSVEHLN